MIIVQSFIVQLISFGSFNETSKVQTLKLPSFIVTIELLKNYGYNDNFK